MAKISIRKNTVSVTLSTEEAALLTASVAYDTSKMKGKGGMKLKTFVVKNGTVLQDDMVLVGSPSWMEGGLAELALGQDEEKGVSFKAKVVDDDEVNPGQLAKEYKGGVYKNARTPIGAADFIVASRMPGYELPSLTLLVRQCAEMVAFRRKGGQATETDVNQADDDLRASCPNGCGMESFIKAEMAEIKANPLAYIPQQPANRLPVDPAPALDDEGKEKIRLAYSGMSNKNQRKLLAKYDWLREEVESREQVPVETNGETVS